MPNMNFAGVAFVRYCYDRMFRFFLHLTTTDPKTATWKIGFIFSILMWDEAYMHMGRGFATRGVRRGGGGVSHTHSRMQ